MREPIRDLGRLQHIHEQIEIAQRFVENRSLDDLYGDVLFRYALVKCLEIIGEASYMLTLEFKDAHPQTPWNKIVAMRHVMVHGYYAIEMPIVWSVVQNDLLQLKPQIEQYIAELSAQQN